MKYSNSDLKKNKASSGWKQSAGSSVLTAIQETRPLESLEKWKLIKPLTLLRASRLVALGGGNPEPLIHRAIERLCQSDSATIDEVGLLICLVRPPIQ